MATSPIWTACLSLLAASVSAEDRVHTVDARAIAGRVVAVSADKVEVQTKGGKQSIARADVADVLLTDKVPPDAMARAGSSVVVTVGGDVLPAKSVRFAADQLTLTTAAVGSIRIRADHVAAVYPAHVAMAPQAVLERCRELKLTAGAEDLLVLVKEKDNWLPVRGVLKTMDAKNITFRWKGADRTVRARLVPAILLATTGKTPGEPQGVLTATDGTEMAFASLTMDDKAATVEMPGAGKLRVPRKAVARISFRSQRVVALGDLKPVRVKEHGFFDRVFHYRANRAVSGRPLRLGGQTYDSGLGLHSFCEVTWELGGAYSKLVAVVGIDDSVRPAGNAQLAFLADGKPLGDPLKLTGKDEPKTVRLPLGGAKQLTVRVDFGPDGLDVADHVDLAVARLIK